MTNLNKQPVLYVVHPGFELENLFNDLDNVLHNIKRIEVVNKDDYDELHDLFTQLGFYLSDLEYTIDAEEEDRD